MALFSLIFDTLKQSALSEYIGLFCLACVLCIMFFFVRWLIDLVGGM